VAWIDERQKFPLHHKLTAGHDETQERNEFAAFLVDPEEHGVPVVFVELHIVCGVKNPF
jgi:hypothetical protein